MILLACWTALSGQPEPAGQNLVVRAWKTEAGLPQNTINAMVQGTNGYLWLGTRDGLARFDGVRFTVYDLTEGLQSVDISALLEDAAGTLWIGTVGGGLSRMVKGQVETYTAASRQIPGDNITSLATDSSGRLWIGTLGGLVVWQGGAPISEPGLAVLSRRAIRSILRDRSGGMWIATITQGLFEYREGRLIAHRGPAGNERISAYCLLEDGAGRIWASVGNGTILHYADGRWGAWTQSDGLPFAYITCLAEGRDGTVWAGSLDDGLYYFDGTRFQTIAAEPGLSAADIRCLLPDHEGNVWVGTRTGGLNQLSRRKLIHRGAAHGLTNEFTRSITQTPDGRIWVATIGGGLYSGGLDGFLRFGPEPVIQQYASVESVLAASDGSLWWGSYRSLFRWRQERLEGCYTNESWLGSAAVTALCDDLAGGIWAGTSDGALAHFQDGVFRPFPKRVARGPITALAQETNGFLWLGSAAGGLKRLSPAGGEVVSVTNGLASHSIRTLFLDHEGTLWIGTAGGGLGRWKNGQVTSFAPEQGIDVRTVGQIVEDDRGFLWLGSSRGIYRISKADLNKLAEGKLFYVHPRIYGVNDGMPEEECSSGFAPAGLKTKTGLICFSTVKGLVFVDPGRQEPDAPPPVVLTEEVLLRGKVHARGGPRASDRGREPVIIPAGGGELQIQYTAITFAAPDKASFRYRLEGFDQEWIEAGTRRTAYYPRLPAGEYEFRVMACNADGVWNQEGASLALVVRPYLWERPWFLGLLTVFGVAALTAGLRWNEQRKFRRRLAALETQHAVQKERLRISQDMHDHIGGILTQVTILSDVGLSEARAHAGAAGQFQKIGTQARAAVQGLDEIIWATNPKNDNLPRFGEYVSRFADEYFESTGIRCWQELPGDLPNLPLRADARHNVFLAIREAFHNVVKHSGAREVWLRLAVEDGQVRIEIEDNGRGFDPGQAEGGGNGLGNMRTRLQEVRGRVELASSPGKGTRLAFVFPLTKS